MDRSLLVHVGVGMSNDLRRYCSGKPNVHGKDCKQRPRVGHVGDVRDATHGSSLQYGN